MFSLITNISKTVHFILGIKYIYCVLHRLYFSKIIFLSSKRKRKTFFCKQNFLNQHCIYDPVKLAMIKVTADNEVLAIHLIHPLCSNYFYLFQRNNFYHLVYTLHRKMVLTFSALNHPKIFQPFFLNHVIC